MTKGTSSGRGSTYGNLILGNTDKLMISFQRELSEDYIMSGACGVVYQGEIHFFGGEDQWPESVLDSSTADSFSRQHFTIEMQRSGQMVKMTKKEDLEAGFRFPSCSSFEITLESFLWFQPSMFSFVVLCFDYYGRKSCFLFDGQLSYLGDSNFVHHRTGLTTYKNGLFTVGGWDNQKTEIVELGNQFAENGSFFWSIVEPDFTFTRGGKRLSDHSLVTIKSSDMNEEFVLLTGGFDENLYPLKNVFKFNGTWLLFGELQKTRSNHNSIYYNGAVYVIGGLYDLHDHNGTKTEIWNIQDSPNKFKIIENWPEVRGWFNLYLFIVPDSFFPDH